VGEFEVTVDDETKVLGPGDVAIVPSFARHKARAITDCRCIDVFSPVREPYKV
jgi:quercetin dioxygenase-like cupin family protein